VAQSSKTIAVCLLLSSGLAPALAGQEAEQERSGLWVRAGLDLGSLRVNRQHNGTLAGVRFAAGWTLSSHITAGVQSGFYPNYTPGERRTTWLAGPEARWYPFEVDGLALRGGLNLVHFRERGEVISPDNGSTNIRDQRFRGLVGHLGAAVSQPIGEHVLLEFVLEFGYAFTGTWRDNTTGPVTGRPRLVALWLAFGVD
jgi:hypothetical protein